MIEFLLAIITVLLSVTMYFVQRMLSKVKSLEASFKPLASIALRNEVMQELKF